MIKKKERKEKEKEKRKNSTLLRLLWSELTETARWIKKETGSERNLKRKKK